MVEFTERQILLIDDTEKYLSSYNSIDLLKDIINMNKEQINEVVLGLILLVEDTKGDLEKATDYEDEMKKVCDDNLIGCNPDEVDECLRTSSERYYMLEREIEEKDAEISNLESEVLAERYPD